LEKVIVDLLQKSFGDEMIEKILGCIKAYREASLEKHSASAFNTFMPEFKTLLMSEKRTTFWKRIVNDEFGLILVIEDNSSSMTREDGREFLAWTQEMPKEDTTEADDDDDLVINFF
jgi:hypothetical protein